MATEPELVLDRFVPAGGCRAIDLATGEPVLLRHTSPGGQAEARSRVEAAAKVWTLRIPGMAALVDYGVDGRRAWVEAYRLDPAAARDRSSAAGAIPVLLSRAGCAVREERRRCDSETTAAGLFIPAPFDRVTVADASTTAHVPAGRAAPPAVGTVIERRDELEPVMECITGDAEAGARIVRIVAPSGAGLRTFLEAIAREARLAGFVPVSSRLCSQAFVWPPGLDGATLCAVLRNRHLVILDAPGDRGHLVDGDGIARFLSRLDTTGGRPHALVCGARSPEAHVAIPLAPMRPDQLRRSVLCAGIGDDRIARAIGEATRRSGGWPAAFSSLVRVLLGLRAEEQPYRRPRPGADVVREAAAQPREAALTASNDGTETASLLARATGLVGRGRHAAAERLLRRAVGYLHRRQRDLEEARAQLALGRLLLARGRRSAARDAFEQCRRLSDNAQDAAGVVRALLHLGSAYIDDGDLSAAESVLRTAGVGAARAALGELGRGASLLLARCLFWQGKHDDAWQQVERLTLDANLHLHTTAAVAERCVAAPDGTGWGTTAAEPRDPPGLSAVAAEIGVRLALARNDAGLAARRLAAASDGRPDPDPVHAGSLIALSILVQGSLGDTEAVTRTVTSGLESMRRRHVPLAAQELRLAQLEALIDAGARVQAAACCRRLSRRAPLALSGLARLRFEALSTRLRHLEGDRRQEVRAIGGTIDTESVLRILQHCHESQSDSDAVGGVCQTVRAVLGAGAVSAFALIEGAVRLVASAGSRACRSELAERAAVSMLVVGPEQTAAGLELAAPIRYGGAAIGALAVRWPPGTTGQESRACGILAAAAAAVGPAMATLCSAGAGKHGAESCLGDLGGPSAAMAELRGQVSRAAAAPYPVLILGESGTGKELIAKAIHARSARRTRRFCAVNCAALSDDLFDTELFGHARGSFTGATADRPGLFEDADGGTLFLDEVGELSPRAQAKLLRAIQEGEIRRVGENHPRRVDARIVAATNRLLSDDVRAGRFRHDLLYRLDVVRIVVPPLRERPEDVGPLARGFWREAMRRIGGQAELSPATLAALARYDWPGNVRELQNTLAALAVHAPPRGRVGPARLPAAIAGSDVHIHGEPTTLADARRRFEERFVRATLARMGGHRTEAASALGLSRQGLAKLIVRLGIGDGDGPTQTPPS